MKSQDSWTQNAIEMFFCLITVTLMEFVVLSCCSTKTGDDWHSLTIRMPNVTAEKADDLICTAKKLNPEEAYIVKITPHASKEIAHHMMIYGCHDPASHSSFWKCDQEWTNFDTKQYSVCSEDGRRIIFAWALDSPGISFPKDVGLRVSGNTGINYLVIQLHYAHRFSAGVTDNSGYTIELTNIRKPQQVGYLILGNWGTIPPRIPAFYVDSTCELPLNYTIYPIAFRTHSHNLGVLTSGYRIRNGKWLEIGRMSPQLPQAFYNVSNPGMDIKPGDFLGSRCVMNSMSRQKVTQIGNKNSDEMCNFYIMYETNQTKNLNDTMCFQETASKTYRGKFPHSSESLEGIPGAETVKEKFKMV